MFANCLSHCEQIDSPWEQKRASARTEVLCFSGKRCRGHLWAPSCSRRNSCFTSLRASVWQDWFHPCEDESHGTHAQANGPFTRRGSREIGDPRRAPPQEDAP